MIQPGVQANGVGLIVLDAFILHFSKEINYTLLKRMMYDSYLPGSGFSLLFPPSISFLLS